MELHVTMSKKVSTCLYIDRGVVEAARNAGLNISKVAENALIEATSRLLEQKQTADLDSHPPRSFEGRGRDLNPGARLHRPVSY
jgi:post-segregation antitoxin (ccd killing protein)